MKRDKYFYISRYIDILREKYPRAEEFAAYGEALWGKDQGVCRRGTVMEICTGEYP